MGDPTPAGDGLDPIVTAIKGVQRETRELSDPSGTQRAQAVRKLEETVEGLAAVVAAMPIATSGNASSTLFAMTGGVWNSIAIVNIPAPAGKTLAAVIAVTSGQIVADLNPGQLATLSQRLLINGLPSPAFYPEYRAGTNVLYHPIVSSFGAAVAGGVVVELQVLPGSTAAFPPRADSQVALSVIAIYNS